MEPSFGSMDYTSWYNKIRWILLRFSDTDYQQRVWIEGAGPEADSYEEAVNYLDDFGFDVFVNRSEEAEMIGADDAEALKSFRAVLTDFDNSVTVGRFSRPEDFKHEKWSHVVHAAREALEHCQQTGLEDSAIDYRLILERKVGHPGHD